MKYHLLFLSLHIVKSLNIKTMKKRFEDLTRRDLIKLRKEIVLNSLFISDYENSFGFSPKSVNLFFDSYISFLDELAEEDNFNTDDINKFFNKYDTIDNLENWYNCYEDFDWVEYVEDEGLDDDFYRGLTNQH